MCSTGDHLTAICPGYHRLRIEGDKQRMITSIRSAGRALADRPQALRWLGFAGSALLSAGAYVGGALPTLVPNVNPVTIFERPEGPLIYVLWFFGTVCLVSAWGMGRRHIG